MRRGGEARQKQELQQLCLVQASRNIRGLQAFFNHFGADALGINPAPVVANAHFKHARVVARLQAQVRGLAFASGQAVLWTFNTVINGVAQHVIQRSLQTRKHIAINRHVRAFNIKLNFLAKLLGKIADHSWVSSGHIAKGSHAASNDLVIQLRSNFLGASKYIFQKFGVACQTAFNGGQARQ